MELTSLPPDKECVLSFWFQGDDQYNLSQLFTIMPDKREEIYFYSSYLEI